MKRAERNYSLPRVKNSYKTLIYKKTPRRIAGFALLMLMIQKKVCRLMAALVGAIALGPLNRELAHLRSHRQTDITVIPEMDPAHHSG
jgi:hypothetical protein